MARQAALGTPAGPTLIAYLEDRYIRQLTPEARAGLRGNESGALHAYLEELGASEELLAASDAGHSGRVESWLLNLALHYEYGDNQAKYEEAATAAAAASTSSETLIAAADTDLLGLLRAFGVPAAASSTESLQQIVKAARQRPRIPPPSATVPPPKSLPAKRALASSASRPPLEGLSASTFPLGFETGGGAGLESAARVLRMLHVRELRRLQDEVNRVIVALQEFTANPKTDARLGRVGM